MSVSHPWHPTPVVLPGKSHGQRSLVGCSPWGLEQSDTTEQLYFHFSLSCIGEGNGNPLQCSCLENPRDEGVWWAAVYGFAQSRTWLKRLSGSSSSSMRHWLIELFHFLICFKFQMTAEWSTLSSWETSYGVIGQQLVSDSSWNWGNDRTAEMAWERKLTSSS